MSSRARGRVKNVGAAVVAGGLLVALLGACSGGDEPASDQSAPASEAGEGDATPLAVEEDGLPADFPRDEVPVVDGQIVSVSAPEGGDDDAYTLLLYLGDTTRADAVSEAVTQLEDAGWTARTSIEGDEPAPQVLTKSDGVARQVVLTNSAQRDETALSYSVVVTG